MTLLLMICHSFCSAKYYYKSSCHVLFYEVLLLPFNSTNSLPFSQSSAISLIPVKSIMTLYSNNNTIMTWFTELFDSPIAIYWGIVKPLSDGHQRDRCPHNTGVHITEIEIL